jgi:hypothetical protein
VTLRLPHGLFGVASQRIRHYNSATGRVEEIDCDAALVRVDVFQRLSKNSDALGYVKELRLTPAEFKRVFLDPKEAA